ncbi:MULTISPECIES: Fic family protein [Sulfitobacter]|uniref:Fic family protein n=1 Tax=unclassified Sulfitobacter TaxID=196795 RepID=UPI001F332631|nr:MULTISPECIES: Fic family protein [unclassified Sulfitobacter]MEC7299232.1 Fic family protein [Pseudomonadota bacterium]
MEELETLQSGGSIAIRSKDMSRTHRERLLKAGFLKEVMKGWYIPSRPDENAGESTAWYTSFWGFCAQYLSDRFGTDWSLSPEQSLIIHAGNTTVPAQLLVRAVKGGNSKTDLPHNTSLFETRATIASDEALEIVDNLRLFSVEDALILVPEVFFQNHPTEARTVLAMMPDASRLLGKLLDGGHTRAAGRLAGAFRSIGSEKVADEILAAMKAASHDVREINPFEQSILVPNAGRITSPHVHRIRLKWESMRDDVIDLFPKAQPITNDIDAYLKQIDEIYVTDAYHSLSIEGYRVSPELIDKVRSGTWNPETDEQDRALKDALAARGYWEAFQRVKESIRAVLEGADAGEVVERDLSDWYRNLFAPSVTAGILKASQLAGYRSSPVYIRQSQHVPMSPEAVRDCMPVFFDLLKAEDDPTVRIVLGHFIFVFIHPFLDGNGRIARFLMNVMMAAAGQPWTVIKLEQRAAYMAALETASVREDIRPFAAFLAETRAAQ